MRIRLFLLSALMVLTLAACGNVREMKFTDTNHEEVIGEVLQSGDLTDDEKTQFSLVVGKAQATGQSLTGKSVADILNESKAGGQ
ncbi:MAG: hypothetical protein HZA22_03650 [Nitrospirae bacterium]|nr:hypothetical protein [Nitrospirota bacterium]MBI5696596.1 hypothetical protein [Nitrospirota bacterium]